jgi:hypothetical protein
MSDELPVYAVTVSREDNLWVAVVDDLPGGATDVSRFYDLHDAVYDLIATLTDTEPGEFWVEWKFLQGSYRLFEMLRDLHQWERQAEVALASRDAARRALVDAMRDVGLSYREIADVIGTSHQRVGQILEKLEKKERDAGADFQVGDYVVQVKSWQSTPTLTRTLTKLIAARYPDAFSYPRPLEGAIVMFLQLALQIAPLARHELLTTTAAILEGAAEDDEFLRQTVP